MIHCMGMHIAVCFPICNILHKLSCSLKTMLRKQFVQIVQIVSESVSASSFSRTCCQERNWNVGPLNHLFSIVLTYCLGHGCLEEDAIQLGRRGRGVGSCCFHLKTLAFNFYLLNLHLIVFIQKCTLRCLQQFCNFAHVLFRIRLLSRVFHD